LSISAKMRILQLVMKVYGEFYNWTIMKKHENPKQQKLQNSENLLGGECQIGFITIIKLNSKKDIY
jgi:hypothetical protein